MPNKITLSNDTSPATKPVWDEAVQGVYVPNAFEMHAGASTWGRGRFLMRKADYEALWPSGGGGGTLTMTDDTASAGKLPHAGSLAISIVAAGYRHVAASTTTGGKSDSDDLVEAVVYDLRSTRLSEMIPQFGYNVGNPADGTHYTATLNTGVDWTWDTVADDLAFLWSVAAPAWAPENLVFDGTSALRAIDMLARTLIKVVGFDHQLSLIDDAITLYDPDELCATNTELLASASGFRTGGGITARAAARKPATVQAFFPVIATDGAAISDPFGSLGRWYTKDVATGISGASGTVPLMLPNFAHLEDSVIVNYGDLDTIAAEVAARAILSFGATIEEITYAGLWPFRIDGRIRGVLWISDARGARTVIRKNDDTEFAPWDVGKLAYELSPVTRVSAWGSVAGSPGPAGAHVYGGPCADHTLLNAVHTDTLADNVVRGDVVFGNATPKWARFAKPALHDSSPLQIAGWDADNFIDYGFPSQGSYADAGNIIPYKVEVDANHDIILSIYESDIQAPAAHDLLSARHGDTLADAVVRGDIIFGNDTPKWARFVKPTLASSPGFEEDFVLAGWDATDVRSFHFRDQTDPAGDDSSIGYKVDLNVAGDDRDIILKIPIPNGSSNYDMTYWDAVNSKYVRLAATVDLYKVIQIKGDGTLGWDYVRAH